MIAPRFLTGAVARSLLVLSTCITVALATHAEDATNVQSDALNTPVRLIMGNATLKSVVEELSRASGARIVAAEYLNDRKLGVYLNKLTIRQALDSLSELNGWAWTMQEDGTYLIERPQPRLPRDISRLGTALTECLPHDIRRFLGIRVEPKELLLPREPNRPNADDPVMELHDQVERKLQTLVKELEIPFFASLKPAILDGKRRPITEISLDKRQKLVEILCLHSLIKLNLGMICGSLKAYERNPAEAQISFGPGEQIAVSVTTQEGNVRKRSGFAVPLEDPKPIPNP